MIHVSKPVAKENYKALGASKIWETNWKPYSTPDFYASYKISPNVNLSAGNVGDKYYVDVLSAGLYLGAMCVWDLARKIDYF